MFKMFGLSKKAKVAIGLHDLDIIKIEETAVTKTNNTTSNIDTILNEETLRIFCNQWLV